MTNEQRDEKIDATHDAVIKMQATWGSYCKLVDELARTVKGHNNTLGHAARIDKLEWFARVAVRIMGPALFILLAAGVGWAFSKF